MNTNSSLLNEITALAVSDGLLMSIYIPFALIYVIDGTKSHPDRYSLTHVRYILALAIVSVILHSISIWLTVTLGVFRYLLVRFPQVGAQYCNTIRAKVTVVSISVVVTLVCIPNSISYELKSKPYNTSDNSSNACQWWVDVKADTAKDIFLFKFNLGLQAVLVKLLPCVLLTIFSVLLIPIMKDAEIRLKKLKTNDINMQTTESSSSSYQARRSKRRTRMLLTVAILFLVSETPQGILTLLILTNEDYFNMYISLGDFLDIIVLINSGINFAIYCSMNKQFRNTFVSICYGLFLKIRMGLKTN